MDFSQCQKYEDSMVFDRKEENSILSVQSGSRMSRSFARDCRKSHRSHSSNATPRHWKNSGEKETWNISAQLQTLPAQESRPILSSVCHLAEGEGGIRDVLEVYPRDLLIDGDSGGFDGVERLNRSGSVRVGFVLRAAQKAFE